MTIWKFELGLQDMQHISMPQGAKLLAVEMQGRGPCLWALVDPEKAKVFRRIAIVGTGNPAPSEDQATYVATFQQPPFVWHVFDGGEA